MDALDTIKNPSNEGYMFYGNKMIELLLKQTPEI